MTVQKAFFATTSLCTGVLIAALAAPAWAQTTTPPDQPAASTPSTPSTDSTQVGELVVTGSRIKTSTYNSPDPLTVITADQAELTGSVDTSQILQLSTVAANAVQINNFFTGFVITGGPGANTLSLRGLGAQRTLFLINGERLGPAGVGGTVGPFDINVLPESIIDHIDILKDGASSIYGSDAVAGVVNVITKTNQDGGEIHLYANPSQGGGGNVYQINGSWGKTFDKGYISAGFDYYRQDALYFGQRPYLNCALDNVRDSTGASADLIDPATGKAKCQNISIANSVIDVGFGPFQEYISNPSAVVNGGPAGFDLNGFQAVGLQLCGNPAISCFFSGDPVNVAATRANAAILPTTSPLLNKATAISPDSRYTFTLFAGYDLTPHVHAYGSLLLNQRDSAQNLVDQFFVEPLNLTPAAAAQLGTNVTTGCTGFCFTIPVIIQQAPATQTVDYARGVIGLKGDLANWGTLKNWTYDIFGQYSYNSGAYSQLFSKTDRVNATAGAADGVCDTSSTQFGGESMAQMEPGVACVPINYLRAVVDGGFTPTEAAFLYSNEYGHTTYSQAYIDGSVTGDIYDLPAGPLGLALGFQLRRESIDDVPGPDFVAQNVYNFSTTGVTKGSEDVEEGYGELRIPVLKDVPFVHALDVDISGRFSNYSSYGGNFTYKATVDWKVTDSFAIRGTYGTAFRAPALYELFLANQVSFLDQLGLDPCINYLTQPGLPQIVRTNCGKATGIPANLGGGAVSTAYTGSGESAEILAGGGAGHLKPETSIADTIGFVLTPHWGDADFNLAVDYYNFDISNQIQQFGASNIVNQCYTAQDFPNNPFCTLFTRNPPTGTGFSDITVVNDDYVNVAKEVDQGLDIDFRVATPLPKDFKLTIESSLAWTFYTNTTLLGGSVNNFLGSVGNPKWVGNIDWKLDRGPWTFNWLLYMIQSSSDDSFVGTNITDYNQTGQTVIANYSVPFYTLSNVSVRRKFDKFTIEAGVKNLFNAAPPEISTGDTITNRIGNVPLASQYDLIGRSFYFDIDAKF